ncbi:MAG: vitamin B12-dependent ribonucleotide reductase [Gemmatimonadales bacterium]|nr:vitamin B12-dependent ribonucleotide reductase [Gemmatimonadales bacterium]MDZ4389376.1 vitamin B12-dependent ribonucleotide reductase [Gemmatimonadales bacterium]
MESSPSRGAVDLSPNATTVLEKRYLLKDESGRPVEGAEDLFWRVATTIAAPDAAYGASPGAVTALAEAFYDVMAQRRFMPNSPTLMNAGRPLGQLSACFVLPVEDTLSNGHSGIYDTLRAMALVHQSGGGTGFSFSRLRPRNDIVRSTMGVASGPISFMSLYDSSTDVVKQGGTRRGANMGILRVDHPDILEFIACKDDTTKITNFNISVGVTDAFMAALAAGESYDLIDPRSDRVVGQLEAREVWARIIHGAWKTGEPGVFFIDRANHFNPVPHLGAYEATNPCGEQPLLAYDVCNLGSINLGLFVKDGEIDWDRLRQVVHLTTHFLENVIDANCYPLPEITDLAQRIRRIGLGVMGLADLFIRLGIPYDSAEAVDLGRQVQRFVDEEAKNESERLATLRGVFPEWERSIWGPDATCARDADGNRIRPMRRLRNCNVTTVAPTGTISIIAGCSSGIEPLFAVAFMRNQAGVLMPDVNEDFLAIAKREGWHSEELMRRIAEQGNIQIDGVPAKWQRVFVTANHIAPEWHIRMQAAFQEYNDSAISKTCNFANDASEEYVEQIYLMAYELGCKGVTVYRDGSRDYQVLSTGSTAKKVAEDATRSGRSEARADLDMGKSGEADATDRESAADLAGQLSEAQAEIHRLHKIVHELESESLQRRQKRSRPELLKGSTRRLQTPLGDLYVNITEDEKGQPFEVFMSLGKAGGALMADVEAIGRLVSLALRSGIPMKEVYRQLRGISSDRAIGMGPGKVLSVPDAVGIALERFMADKQGVQQDLLTTTAETAVTSPPVQVVRQAEQMQLGGMKETLAGACPDCGSQLEFAEGCMKCHICGYSECG